MRFDAARGVVGAREVTEKPSFMFTYSVRVTSCVTSVAVLRLIRVAGSGVVKSAWAGESLALRESRTDLA